MSKDNSEKILASLGLNEKSKVYGIYSNYRLTDKYERCANSKAIEIFATIPDMYMTITIKLPFINFTFWLPFRELSCVQGDFRRALSG